MRSKRFFGTIIALAALALCLAPAGSSQTNSETARGSSFYNLKTETTVKGTVEAVRKVRGWRDRERAGTHLTLKTESGTFDVHVGPAAYLQKQDFTFAKGDKIEVTGSEINYHGRQAIIAREIIKNGKTLTLRDAQGFPAWAGQRRGGAMN